MHQKVGVSTEEINEAVVRLLKFRINIIQPGNLPKFYCFTQGDGEGLLDEIQVIKIQESSLALIDEDWSILQLFDHSKLQSVEDKNIIWNPRLVPLDLCQTAILSHIPHPGEVLEMPDGHGLDLETMQTIKDKKLPFIELPMKWWSDEGHTEYMGEWYMTFHADTLSHIAEGCTVDEVEDYKDKGGVWKYIEDKFAGVVLPTKLAQFTPYYLNNQEKNEDLNAQFEEKIRPYFPADWYPPFDDDMDAPLFSYNHEWRTSSKQVRFVFLDGTDAPKSDMYARLWFI